MADLWQRTQLDSAPWSWQAAHWVMRRRASRPWLLGEAGESHPAPWGERFPVAVAVIPLRRWQRAQLLGL